MRGCNPGKITEKTGGLAPSNASPAIGVRRSTHRDRTMPTTVDEPNSDCFAGLQSRLLVRQQRAMMCREIRVNPEAYATSSQAAVRVAHLSAIGPARRMQHHALS
jgi:hypothetical protein